MSVRCPEKLLSELPLYTRVNIGLVELADEASWAQRKTAFSLTTPAHPAWGALVSWGPRFGWTVTRDLTDYRHDPAAWSSLLVREELALGPALVGPRAWMAMYTRSRHHVWMYSDEPALAVIKAALSKHAFGVHASWVAPLLDELCRADSPFA